MKPALHCIAFCLLLASRPCFSQGNSCSTPYSLTLDGVSRDYSITSLTGLALHCTNSIYVGTGHITIFSFTTNASASCVLIDLTTSGLQPAEALLYNKCSGGGALQNLETASSVCFDDGTGLWAPSETLVLMPNHLYFLRVWTPGTGTLTLSAKNYDPPNNTCAGATVIGTTPVADNNACHKPSTEVTPIQLCAFSLENTAFYRYTIDVSGISVLMISHISCDNSAAGATAGFQIGFFTGSCGSLIPLSCYAAIGGTVTAPTDSLPSGTQVTVAIDGMSGSNCSYLINAFNAVFLPVSIKYFTAWVAPRANTLRWVTTNENGNTSFEIEKSPDGLNFHPIGTVREENNPRPHEDYTFEDRSPWPDQFYRLRIVGIHGEVFYSNIIHVKRGNIETGHIIQNPVSGILQAKIISQQTEMVRLQILDGEGRLVKIENSRLEKGEHIYSLDIGQLPNGIYYLVIPGQETRSGYKFIKL